MPEKRKSSPKGAASSSNGETKTKKASKNPMTDTLESLITWLQENGALINNIEERNSPGRQNLKSALT
jgi:hypothetical protein